MAATGMESEQINGRESETFPKYSLYHIFLPLNYYASRSSRIGHFPTPVAGMK